MIVSDNTNELETSIITCENIKVGHLIDKESIKPVFLRMDSELADKSKK